MLYVQLDRNNTLSLSKQVYLHIRKLILNGELRGNEKLPSSRELASSLNISRNVIINSYEQLFAEGYIYTKSGSGSYVTNGVTLDRLPTESRSITTAIQETPDNLISFKTGIPDLSCIPTKKWGMLYKEICYTMDFNKLDYQAPLGMYELRKELCFLLYKNRGVICSPDDIIITTGAAQAFTLLCSLISKQDYALVENPLSYGLYKTLIENNVRVQPVEVDEHGMNLQDFPDTPPKLIFLTPSHQFPSGGVLSIKRRTDLIKYARQNNIYIIEDDYDSEFRYNGAPIQSMHSLSPENVIYVGTFSKTLMPSLRLGYMILPEVLKKQLLLKKYIADIHCPTIEQLTLAKFIRDDYYELHINKMRNLYLKKRNLLVKCLKNLFRDDVTIAGTNAGLHLVASFSGVTFDDKCMAKIKDNGVLITPVRTHYIKDGEGAPTPYDNALTFGYGNTNFEDIELGVKYLYNALK